VSLRRLHRDGFDAAKETLARYGAEKVYRVENAERHRLPRRPQAELLAQLVEKTSPARGAHPEQQRRQGGFAARLAIKTSLGA
jgi:electron transfer flavoprotein alpha subunit